MKKLTFALLFAASAMMVNAQTKPTSASTISKAKKEACTKSCCSKDAKDVCCSKNKKTTSAQVVTTPRKKV